jgi:hypothetical protein
MLTQSELKTLVSYDSETGVFTRIDEPKPRILKGINGKGYVQMTLRGQFYYGHRLAWFYMHDEWPKYLDHINRDPGDNRIANLRVATQSENMANTTVRKDSKIGLKGVEKAHKGPKWRARFLRKHLGCFDSPELAHEAYLAAARMKFGEFACSA